VDWWATAWSPKANSSFSKLFFYTKGVSMTGPDPTLYRTASIFRTEALRRRPARTMRGEIALLIVAAALALGSVSPAFAQNPPAGTPPPTSPTVPCLPGGQGLVMPPEINAPTARASSAWPKSFSACPRLPQGTRIARSN